MPATVTKRLCLPVGSYKKDGQEKPQIEYREIGVVVQYENGQGEKWSEIKLHADILNPTLFSLAKSQMEKGTSNARVKLFDVARKVKDNAPAGDVGPAHEGLEDDVPF